MESNEIKIIFSQRGEDPEDLNSTYLLDFNKYRFIRKRRDIKYKCLNNKMY